MKNNIIQVVKPELNFDLLSPETRDDGISGFIRCKNEGEYLEQVIDSWIDIVDELVIVYNDCSDNTQEIIQKALQRYDNKIKAFHYLPKVWSQGSDKYKLLDANDYGSLVNYYNFSLMQTTKKWAVKIDGDIILIPDRIKQIREIYNKISDNEFLKLGGVNIIMQNNNIFCLSESLFCGIGGDLCLFRVDKQTYFTKDCTCEKLKMPISYKAFRVDNNSIENSLISYYHMKFQKSDFGLGVYDFKNNKNTNYYPKTWIFIHFSKLIPLSEVCRKFKLNIQDPRDFIKFNINYVDYKQNFMAYLSAMGGGSALSVWLKEIYLYVKIKINKIYKKTREIIK
ncbi:glycosyltransferase family 2 protein [Campylobacter sp. faydin G-24]|uniref:Glycosyltransferase family 2 protein n=1 Tax=Campylobacter anatolicus TaxID=2829105 RepID=A0ABS5HHG3_9BACT|nr:glycosyltransferase [Campylobacter anatolicus]MBR8462164.1 glycosyltransferase family 2 protein [Campylobacter anatolicus]MBR8463719.1 glycosyltransferase family 2 protein [Campylobacter anatolicus]